ncbi:hypothetical protein J2Y45_001534 [Dyadobacter sp. BE34]|uniref:Uncharacterized protein n=1 Tax=Dyadobacter fermentans TaxID=94254 RepID=A0ABU1QVD5_9BACT|nr:hypothetical protein [Dyadobacter fermentans]MDR7042005.1 hypothetical protein [Dyadobacter sp. BE242]MDR7196408.1 hypothetical protein [Dyadobacter sp. BE34]MDR7213047.1 hypothetical protein [Dyadobacter sp. BE31]MDR7261814.1 hypothetical protein [Dyadobacter sp. BE32]
MTYKAVLSICSLNLLNGHIPSIKISRKLLINNTLHKDNLRVIQGSGLSEVYVLAAST